MAGIGLVVLGLGCEPIIDRIDIPQGTKTVVIIDQVGNVVVTPGSMATEFAADVESRVLFFRKSSLELFRGAPPMSLQDSWPSEPMPSADTAARYVPGQGWTSWTPASLRIESFAARCAATVRGVRVLGGTCTDLDVSMFEPSGVNRPTPPGPVRCRDGGSAICLPPALPTVRCGPSERRDVATGACVLVGTACDGVNALLPSGRTRVAVPVNGLEESINSSQEDAILILDPGDHTGVALLSGHRILAGSCASETRLHGRVQAASGSDVEVVNLEINSNDGAPIVVEPDARLSAREVVITNGQLRVMGGELSIERSRTYQGVGAVVGSSTLSIDKVTMGEALPSEPTCGDGGPLLSVRNSMTRAHQLELTCGFLAFEGGIVDLDRLNISTPIALNNVTARLNNIVTLRQGGLRILGTSSVTLSGARVGGLGVESEGAVSLRLEDVDLDENELSGTRLNLRRVQATRIRANFDAVDAESLLAAQLDVLARTATLTNVGLGSSNLRVGYLRLLDASASNILRVQGMKVVVTRVNARELRWNDELEPEAAASFADVYCTALHLGVIGTTTVSRFRSDKVTLVAPKAGSHLFVEDGYVAAGYVVPNWWPVDNLEGLIRDVYLLGSFAQDSDPL